MTFLSAGRPLPLVHQRSPFQQRVCALPRSPTEASNAGCFVRFASCIASIAALLFTSVSSIQRIDHRVRDSVSRGQLSERAGTAQNSQTLRIKLEFVRFYRIYPPFAAAARINRRTFGLVRDRRATTRRILVGSAQIFYSYAKGWVS